MYPRWRIKIDVVNAFDPSNPTASRVVPADFTITARDIEDALAHANSIQLGLGCRPPTVSTQVTSIEQVP